MDLVCPSPFQENISLVFLGHWETKGSIGGRGAPKNVTWYAARANLHLFGMGGVKNVCCPRGACPT